MIIKAYRGQHGSQNVKIHSRLPSISFGSLNASRIYANSPNNLNDKILKPMILSAKIRIDNPIINNDEDCFADFNILIKKLGIDFMWQMAEKFASYIYNTNNWEENFSQYHSITELKMSRPMDLGQLYMDAYVLLDDETFVRQAMTKGYDGAIHQGNGETAFELEYRIFSQSQIIHIEEMINN